MHWLIRTRAWQALVDHQRSMENVHLRNLFTNDPQRSDQFSPEIDNLFLDYSKTGAETEALPSAHKQYIFKTGFRASLMHLNQQA